MSLIECFRDIVSLPSLVVEDGGSVGGGGGGFAILSKLSGSVGDGPMKGECGYLDNSQFIENQFEI